jgi:hypothetical protein
MKMLPKARNTNIVVQETGKEILIYDLIINKAFHLNETAALVYQLCDGRRTVNKISELMSKKLETNVSADIVWLFMKDLKRNNLLDNYGELTNYFAGLTRREVIRKIGLASMVALPVIIPVVVPLAAHAQSACANPGGSPAGTNLTGFPSQPDCPTCLAFGSTFCCSGNATLNSCGAVGGGGVACNIKCS